MASCRSPWSRPWRSRWWRSWDSRRTVALALVAVLGFALLRRTEGDDILTALGKGTAPRRRPIRQAGVRTFATTAGWVLAVVLLLPHLTLEIGRASCRERV